MAMAHESKPSMAATWTLVAAVAIGFAALTYVLVEVNETLTGIEAEAGKTAGLGGGDPIVTLGPSPSNGSQSAQWTIGGWPVLAANSANQIFEGFTGEINTFKLLYLDGEDGERYEDLDGLELKITESASGTTHMIKALKVGSGPPSLEWELCDSAGSRCMPLRNCTSNCVNDPVPTAFLGELKNGDWNPTFSDPSAPAFQTPKMLVVDTQ